MPTLSRAAFQSPHIPRCGWLALAISAVALPLLVQPVAAKGIRRTVPLQILPSAATPSPGKLSPDLVELSGRLRSLPAEERQRLSSLRWYQSEVPVFRVASTDSGLLQVYLHVEDLSAKTLDGLRENGVWIEQTASDPAVVQGFVSIDDLECIAELPYVQAVTRPTYSICSTMQSVQRQGLYGDETIDAMDVGMLRTAGLDGTGVTVGVLSVGLFDSLYPASGVGLDGRLLSGDLPSVDPNGLGWTLGGILAIPSDSPFYHEVVDAGTLLIPPRGDGFNGLPTGSFFQQRPALWGFIDDRQRPNGALMLEVIYDIAPQARFLFGSSRTDVEFNTSRETLVNYGARVLVDDVAFPGLGRYDGSGPLSRRTSQLVQERDIVCVTAVGDYTPTDPDEPEASASGKPLFINAFFNPDPRNITQKFHSFPHPSEPYRDETLEIAVDPDLGFFEAFLVWDDIWVNDVYRDENNPFLSPIKVGAQGRATDDLDLFIVDSETMDVTHPVASSTYIQNGHTYNPVERIIASDSSKNLSLLIRRKNPFDNHSAFMTIVITAGTVLEPDYLTHGVPLCNSDAVAGVISVGAVGYNAPEFVQPYTIPGLNPGLGAADYGRFLQWRPGVQKPDICSVDSVGTFIGQQRYPDGTNYLAEGTSIAAAHVGGFCALLRQAFPTVNGTPTFHAKQYLAVLTDTSGDPLNANAVEISAEVRQTYGNAPVYKRLQPGNVYANLTTTGVPTSAQTLRLQHDFSENPGLWTFGPAPGGQYALPQFDYADGKLILRSTQNETFGYWESPVLQYVDTSTQTPSSALDPDRLYRIRVRIGSDQESPGTVPDFRIRLITTSTDEAALLVINSHSVDAPNAPTLGNPKDYVLYYQPTPEAAPYGVRLAVDMINFNSSDDPTGSLYIHAAEFEQLGLAPTP